MSRQSTREPRWTPSSPASATGSPTASLRPETDPETEYVAFDRPRVLRVLARIIADLDELAGYPPIAAEGPTEGKNAEARRAHHRRRLAEPDPPRKRLSVQEERAALWEALGRPPQKGSK